MASFQAPLAVCHAGFGTNFYGILLKGYQLAVALMSKTTQLDRRKKGALLTKGPLGGVAGRSREVLCLAHGERESKSYIIQGRDFPLTAGGVTSR